MAFSSLCLALPAGNTAFAHDPSVPQHERSEALERLDATVAEMLDRAAEDPAQWRITDAQWAQVEALIELSYEKDVLDRIEEPALNGLGKAMRLPHLLGWSIRHPIQAQRRFRDWTLRMWQTPLGKAILFNELVLEPGLGVASSKIGGAAYVLVPMTVTHAWDLIYYATVLGLPKAIKAAKALIERGGTLLYFVFEEDARELLKRAQGLARVRVQGRSLEAVIVDGGRWTHRLPKFLRVVSSPVALAAEKRFPTVLIGELETICRKHGVHLGLFDEVRGNRFAYALHLMREIAGIPEAQEEFEALMEGKIAAIPSCVQALRREG